MNNASKAVEMRPTIMQKMNTLSCVDSHHQLQATQQNGMHTNNLGDIDGYFHNKIYIQNSVTFIH